MSTLAPPPRPVATHGNPVVRGVVFGIVSALGYTATNIFLKEVDEFDPFFVSCLKNVPVVVLCAIWIRQGRPGGKPLSARMLLVLLATGVVVQIVGNAGYQWALLRIGLAITVPLSFSTIIAGGAILSRIFLGEPITPRLALAMAVIVAAVVTLSLGAEEAKSDAGAAAAGASAALGVVVACASGLAYSLSGIVIRASANQQASLPATIGLYSLTGVLLLGALALWNSGWSTLAATPAWDLMVMLMAGACNALAFFALGKSLTYLPVVVVNTLNASQAALSAVAGVLLFAEPLTPGLMAGCVLTILGLLLASRRGSTVEDAA